MGLCEIRLESYDWVCVTPDDWVGMRYPYNNPSDMISTIALSDIYLFVKEKNTEKILRVDCLLVLLCESIVRICLVVFNDKLDSMILGIWEYSTDTWTRFKIQWFLSRAIFIDPVNIKQINATKIHDVSNVSDGNLLVGMRYVPAYWL